MPTHSSESRALGGTQTHGRILEEKGQGGEGDAVEVFRRSSREQNGLAGVGGRGWTLDVSTVSTESLAQCGVENGVG